MKRKIFSAAVLAALTISSLGSVRAESGAYNQEIKNSQKGVVNGTSDTMWNLDIITDDSNAKKFEKTALNARYTAKEFLDKNIVSTDGKTLGSVRDILVSPTGDARYVVLSNENFLGIATKLVLMEYASIIRQESDGDVIVPITEEGMKLAQSFDYDATDNTVATSLKNHSLLSVKDLMGRDFITYQDKVSAEIDNVTFRGGKADYAVILVDQTLGMGGKKAALKFNTLQWSYEDDKPTPKLSPGQTTSLHNYSQSSKK